MTDNPLLEEHPLPPFARIMPEHVAPALDARITHIWHVLENQLQADTPYHWENLAAPVEEALDLLEQTWSPISHLNGVNNSEDWRTVYEKGLAQLTAFNTELSQHQGLFQAFQALANSQNFSQLSQAQQTSIHLALRDFHLAGVGLDEAKKHRYKEIRQRLSALSNQFANNVLDATGYWYWHTDNKSELAGLPASALACAQQAAKQRKLSGYVITLEAPAYIAAMTYLDDRQRREQIYNAYVTRASKENADENTHKWDNSPIIDDILALRHELAQLLGFAHYGELSLATKMADDAKQVTDFLYSLAKQSLPHAQQDLQQLRDYAQTQGLEAQLQAWDLLYYSEKLRQAQYDISEEALRAYFPVDKVLTGLFEVSARLFDINITPTDGQTYHHDVPLYCIYKDTTPIAYFYLDLYARDKKRSGAWMADCRIRRQKMDGQLQLPVAYLTCNFSPPVNDQPCLLTHQEVTTLFHEFGHGLHHMLTKVRVASVSGINGVAWDAVELPSQFLENWCWEKSVIPLISSHFRTGETLPEHDMEKLLAAKNFQSGLQMMRQIEFALFDMQLHANYTPIQPTPPQAVIDDVRAQIAVLTPPAYNRFQNSFSHIFAGGYAAGYYSYKWAEVLSADAFSLFEEQGVFHRPTGEHFLQSILSQGGSRPAIELFTQFRGRKPTIDALLRHSGLAKTST